MGHAGTGTGSAPHGTTKGGTSQNGVRKKSAARGTAKSGGAAYRGAAKGGTARRDAGKSGAIRSDAGKSSTAQRDAAKTAAATPGAGKSSPAYRDAISASSRVAGTTSDAAGKRKATSQHASQKTSAPKSSARKSAGGKGGQRGNTASVGAASRKPASNEVSPKGSAPRGRIYGDWIEGRHAVLEALAAQVSLKRILIAENVEEDAALGALIRKAEKAAIPLETCRRSLLDKLSVRGSHQGVMAEAAPYGYATLDDLIEAGKGRPDALVIVLDHITDVGNLGAIIRTAEVVGALGVLVPNKRAAQVTAAAQKTSAGAASYLPIAREASLTSCIKRLKEQGFWIAGASEHAETTLWDAPLEGRIALVMGSESEGISRLVLERCDFLVALPQCGHIESLNVAQATTALAYEWLRRSRALASPVSHAALSSGSHVVEG